MPRATPRRRTGSPGPDRTGPPKPDPATLPPRMAANRPSSVFLLRANDLSLAFWDAEGGRIIDRLLMISGTDDRGQEQASAGRGAAGREPDRRRAPAEARAASRAGSGIPQRFPAAR